mgnify:CR=1 FL=1
MPVVVRTSISNHHPSGKRKKPKPRHNAPCLRQLVRYKLYEIRLDTLKKRRYAPAEPSRAEPSRAEPSRADNNCRIFRSHCQALLLRNIHNNFIRFYTEKQALFVKSHFLFEKCWICGTDCGMVFGLERGENREHT